MKLVIIILVAILVIASLGGIGYEVYRYINSKPSNKPANCASDWHAETKKCGSCVACWTGDTCEQKVGDCISNSDCKDGQSCKNCHCTDPLPPPTPPTPKPANCASDWHAETKKCGSCVACWTGDTCEQKVGDCISNSDCKYTQNCKNCHCVDNPAWCGPDKHGNYMCFNYPKDGGTKYDSMDDCNSKCITPPKPKNCASDWDAGNNKCGVCAACYTGDTCEQNVGNCATDSDCSSIQSCKNCTCVEKPVSCGFTSTPIPSTDNCKAVLSKSPDQVVTEYCGYFDTHSTDWFSDPGSDLVPFGIHTKADYTKLCTSDAFKSCDADTRMKGVLSAFTKYGNSHDC
jgi:hypothetical protein